MTEPSFFDPVMDFTLPLIDGLPIEKSPDTDFSPSSLFFPGGSVYDQGNVVSHSGNHLPHWEMSQTVYHVCFHLKDSIPASQRQAWLAEREQLLNAFKVAERQPDADELKRMQYLFSDKINQYLDNGYGACVLRKNEIAKIVMDSLLFYNDKKYHLFAWCIMPNHVHIIFQPNETLELSEIIHGWKSFTAHAINKALGCKTALWEVDSYNHIIRSLEEFYYQIRYVWNNPDKAGLVNWKWRWMCLEK